MAGEWCLIESDPGVFTELIRGFGVSGVQVEEVYTLDKEFFENLRPVHGLIFLFKWRPEEKEKGLLVQDSRLSSLFFAKQVIRNACATQAILNVLLNCGHSDVDLGLTLGQFKEFTATMDGNMRGLTMTNSDEIREVHNSFSRQQLFEFDESLTKGDEDAYHFVGYVPIGGRLYELDGLKDGPIDHGKCSERDWLETCKPILDERIASFEADEIRFNLMAIVSDRKQIYLRETTSLEETKMQVLEKLEKLAAGEVGMETDVDDPTSLLPDELTSQLEEIESRLVDLQSLIASETEKMHKYKIENIRRKHNYIPLIMEMLKILGERGELAPLVETAVEKRKAAAEAKTAKETNV
ncbi:ubiquitin carboxyl-terminal hydrolase isozyme L5-like [Corticium candelabrum]|uniref:ubiquitin carboxyl-terminal hydrolase isozyme L5-like n=1 Tax=Corticium candelabrum TaxID=121492 RepID=UPI002E26671B|nr:ubiquitin carboxyl-terminal hydrolase isozyme L5-like [Corticium candelabrum]